MKNIIKKILRKKVNPEKAQFDYLTSHGMKVGERFTCYSMNGIDPSNPQLIEIGDDVLISLDVKILTHDASTLIVGCGTKLGRVEIGNKVFIGTRAIVLCNTVIESNVIIGAGSVVSGHLKSGVYAGIPARKICTIEEYRSKYEKMRSECPDMSKILPWDKWKYATDEQRDIMKEEAKKGFLFY